MLLDQNISPAVAAQLTEKRPDLSVVSVYTFRDGELIGVADERVLSTAHEHGLVLIRYDRKTIPPILIEWGISGTQHSGVVFVDNKTIASNDFGALIRAIIILYDRYGSHDWENRIGFLDRDA